MADWHVERLYYTIENDPGTSYEKAQPLTFSHPLGEFHADDRKLTVKLSRHFASEPEARVAVEAFLRAWEIETELTIALGVLRFRFQRADVIDRSLAQGSAAVHISGVAAASFAGIVTLTAVRRSYPSPPTAEGFNAAPEVQLAHQRWREFAGGREHLTSMGYFVLTLLQDKAGGPRKKAASMYHVAFDVLNMVGHLTTNKGGPSGARKVDGVSQELTPKERTWLEEAVKVLIRRMGQVAAGATVSMIRMQDLPKL